MPARTLRNPPAPPIPLRRRSAFHAAALLIGLAPLGAAAQSTQSAALEPTTPKGALKALALAMDHGDADAIRHLMDASTPLQSRMVEVTSEMAAVMADLNRAMAAQFGAAQTQAVLNVSPEQLKQSFTDIDAASETITGDTATVSIAPTDRGTMALHRVNGTWKVSLQKRLDQLTPQQVDEDVAMLSSQIEGMRQVIAAVRAGKYATAADAGAALHARMGAASAGPQGAGPQGRPASQPSSP